MEEQPSEEDMLNAANEVVSVVKYHASETHFVCVQGDNDEKAMSGFVEILQPSHVEVTILTLSPPQLLVLLNRYFRTHYSEVMTLHTWRLPEELILLLPKETRLVLLSVAFDSVSFELEERCNAINIGTHRGDTIERVQGVLERLRTWYEAQVATLV